MKEGDLVQISSVYKITQISNEGLYAHLEATDGSSVGPVATEPIKNLKLFNFNVEIPPTEPKKIPCVLEKGMRVSIQREGEESFFAFFQEWAVFEGVSVARILLEQTGQILEVVTDDVFVEPV